MQLLFGNHLSSRQETNNHKFRAPAKKQFSYKTQEKNRTLFQLKNYSLKLIKSNLNTDIEKYQNA